MPVQFFRGTDTQIAKELNRVRVIRVLLERPGLVIADAEPVVVTNPVRSAPGATFEALALPIRVSYLKIELLKLSQRQGAWVRLPNQPFTIGGVPMTQEEQGEALRELERQGQIELHTKGSRPIPIDAWLRVSWINNPANKTITRLRELLAFYDTRKRLGKCHISRLVADLKAAGFRDGEATITENTVGRWERGLRPTPPDVQAWLDTVIKAFEEQAPDKAKRQLNIFQKA